MPATKNWRFELEEYIRQSGLNKAVKSEAWQAIALIINIGV